MDLAGIQTVELNDRGRVYVEVEVEAEMGVEVNVEVEIEVVRMQDDIIQR
jgi:hypothetical protein